MTPGDIFGGLAASALTVLPWVAYAVTAVVGVALVLVGIRKGLAFFFAIIRGDGSSGSGLGAAEVSIAHYGGEAVALLHAGDGFGYGEEDRVRFVERYIEERVAGQTIKGAKNDAHLEVEL